MVIIKSLRISIIILLVLLISFNFPIGVNAKDSLYISRWLIDSEIKDNGDLEIMEDITFNFDDKFNGVFREIVLEGTSGIKGLQVAEMVEGNEIIYQKIAKGKNGDSNVFTVTDNKDSVSIKIFSPSKDEVKTFRLIYTINNVAVKYNDTGELYYKFLGKDNNTSIDFFGVNIKLPKNLNNRVKIFAHGPLNGNINFKGDDLIRLEVENVPTDTFIEARILFPVDFIPNSNNIVNDDGFDGIMEEELSYIQKIEKKQIRRERNQGLFNNLSIVLSGIGIIAIYFTFSKFRRNTNLYETMDYSLYPEDCTPAVATYLVSSVVNTTTIMATIFDLARKGYLSIEDRGKYKNKVNNFELKRLDKPTVYLLDHEKFLLKWLLDEIGDGNVVTTEDIENYGKIHSTQFYKSYSTWQQKIREEAKNKGYYDNRGKGPGTLLLISSIITFIVSIISLVYEGFYGFILLFISIFAFVYGIILMFRKSDYGYIQYKKWVDFKKDLKQRGDSQDINNLAFSLDTALIYGLALGVNINSLKKFKILISESTMPNHWVYWCFATSHRNQNSFEQSLNKSFSTGGISTGSGGGFSGGGGAGGGGAGGGGAGGF